MRTRRSLIAVAVAAAGWWQDAHHGRGVISARDDAACAEPDDGPMPDRCPRPPRMVLRVPGRESQEAGLGTYCWGVEESACCVDMVEPVYPSCPLVVPAGEEVEIDFAGLGAVSELTLDLRNDPAETGAGRRGRSRRKPGAEAIWRLVLDRPASALRLPAYLPPGGYVIDLFAYADGPDGGGDTSQGFRIVVESEAGTAATPAAGATPVAPGESD